MSSKTTHDYTRRFTNEIVVAKNCSSINCDGFSLLFVYLLQQIIFPAIFLVTIQLNQFNFHLIDFLIYLFMQSRKMLLHKQLKPPSTEIFVF